MSYLVRRGRPALRFTSFAFRKSSPAPIPRASATFSNVVMVGLATPDSNVWTYLISTPISTARSVCVQPNFSRARRMFAARYLRRSSIELDIERPGNALDLLLIRYRRAYYVWGFEAGFVVGRSPMIKGELWGVVTVNNVLRVQLAS